MNPQVPNAADYDALVVRQCRRYDLMYGPLEPGPLVEEVRRQVLTNPRKIAWHDSPEVVELGTAISLAAHYPPPRMALAHRDIALGWHTDRGIDYPWMNATVVFRQDCEGGALVLRDERVAVDCKDGWVVVFDGSRPHGVTPLERTRFGYRASLTYYMPMTALRS